jgi:hypothetical protein
MRTLAASLGAPAPTDVGIVITVSQGGKQDESALQGAFGSANVVAAPVTFNVTGTYGGKTVNVPLLAGNGEATISLSGGAPVGAHLVGVEIVNGAPEHAWMNLQNGTADFYTRSGGTFAIVSHTVNFSDIGGLPQSTAITNLADDLVTTGVTRDTFDPQGGVNREQFAALIVRALGLWNIGQGTKFKDVAASSWAAPTIAAAVSEGFVEGYPNGTFRPDASITNEQMAVMVARVMTDLGIGHGPNTETPADLGKIPSWARGDVELVLSQGVMSIDTQGDFSPGAVTTRAQAAQIIWNLMHEASID